MAQYVKKHFTEEFLQNKNFKLGNLKEAVRENFLKMDELMYVFFRFFKKTIKVRNCWEIRIKEIRKNKQGTRRTA